MPRADRLFALVQLLCGTRFRKLGELTAELGTSARTIYRDLGDLESRGLPIERVDGAYRIATAATVRPLPLTDRERALLAVSLSNGRMVSVFERPLIRPSATFSPARRGGEGSRIHSYARTSRGS